MISNLINISSYNIFTEFVFIVLELDDIHIGEKAKADSLFLSKPLT
jgi:hypothetical protein